MSMNFDNSNRLYELAAADAGLAGELEALRRSYSGRMHEYIFSLARKYGVELEADCFDCGDDAEKNACRQRRLRIVGLILNKKPGEYQKFRDFSRELDAACAAEKVALARAHGIDLTPGEAEALSLWTGIL